MAKVIVGRCMVLNVWYN